MEFAIRIDGGSSSRLGRLKAALTAWVLDVVATFIVISENPETNSSKRLGVILGKETEEKSPLRQWLSSF